MIRFLTTLLCFLPFLALGQDDLPLGEGVLSINIEKSPTLLFYTDTLQAKPFKVISIGRDKDGEFLIRNPKGAAWLRTEQLSLEYYIFVIRVDTVLGKWYRVFANAGPNPILWTKASPEKQFRKWAPFLLKETTAVEPGPVAIKAGPSESSKTIRRVTSKDCFEAVEIKGDWMRIRSNTRLDCDESDKPLKSGWIKWRENGRLLVDYFLTC